MNPFHTPHTLNCRGRLLSLAQPQIMGILNVTPDSFYDGGRYTEQDRLLQQVEQMLTEGASIIDVGGMSSRPGAEVIDVATELRRVIPAVEAIVQRFPEALISVDTVRSRVAQAAVETGAHLINDISAGSIDEAMYETVAALQVPYILMHMKGTPKTMQQQADYDDVMVDVTDFMIREVQKLRALRVKDIVLDVGFGFGKSMAHNYTLLQRMNEFQLLELPLLAGISRKSMIYKLLDITPEAALNGTSALHMVALQQGASILRVHDVKAAREVITLHAQLQSVRADQ